MKPITTLITAGALSFAVVSANAAEKVKMATIAPGTSAYLTMTTFANIVNQNQKDYEFTVDATGAATKHIIEVARGKLDYAMSSPTIHFFLKNGKAMYKKLKDAPKLADKLSLVMWFPYGQYHFIVHEDSGIKTLGDLKGKKVFLGPPGGGAWNAAYSWMKFVGGLDAKKGDFEGVKASWSSAFQGFQDRQFDAYVNGGIAPFPQVEQLSLTSEIRLLGVDKKTYEGNPAAKKYMTGIPGRDLGVIKQGTYGKNVKMDHDIYTNGATVGITVRKDMSEEQVYQVTKAFWDNVAEARKSAPWMNNITMEYAIKEGGLALHPGAQRYYKEIGAKIPAGSMAK
ncbi:MAG: TAXI family TRAP transporter solute-binding subunit [Burkholderiaceae bacterium]